MSEVEVNQTPAVAGERRSERLPVLPLALALAAVVFVSLLFAVFPAFDLSSTTIFSSGAKGFPLAKVSLFEAIGSLGPILVALVLLALLAAVVWKLIHPERPTVLPADKIAFLLASLVALSLLTPLFLLAANGMRVPPDSAMPFGGHDPFAALWHGGGMCSTECAAFAFDTPWAVWLVGVAVLTPLAWRPTAFRALAALAAVLIVSVVARGEDYLSGALLSAAFTTLVVMVTYRLTLQRPIAPVFAPGAFEADLTRAGDNLHRLYREADWQVVSRKAQSPWLDRNGRFSPLKATTFAITIVPGLWLLSLAIGGPLDWNDGLTPLPWVFLIYTTGIWALWLFLASLAVTPVRRIFGWGELISVRRMLGVGGLAYTVLHLLDYVWLDRFSLGFIINEYLTRPTIWVATLATAGIFILGATSLDSVISRMGTAAWTRLHYIAYPAIGLAALHFDMSPASLGGPMYLITGMYAWLMAWRVLQRYRLGTNLWVLLALAIVVPAVSFAFEYVWLDYFQHISDPQNTVIFALDISQGLEPNWELLIIGIAVPLLAAVFGRKSTSRARLAYRNPGSGSTAAPSPTADVAAVARVLAMPLQDRAGRFSPLKAATFALLFLPGLWFVGLGLTGGLTPQPFGFIIYNSGVWAMWLLLFSLAVTPARHILGWPELIAVRRMVGLAGLAYTLFHVVMYFTLQGTTWATVGADFQRLTVIVASVSTLGLIALAVTSFDGAIRSLGARTWNRIHNLAYPAIGLALLHFDMGPESLGGTPFVITGLYFWVMGWRLINRYGRGTDPLALLGLCLASTLLSFAFEATWIRYYRGFTEFGTIDELWAIGLGLAATWQVLLTGLAIAAVGAVFRDLRRVRPERRFVAQPQTSLQPT